MSARRLSRTRGTTRLEALTLFAVFSGLWFCVGSGVFNQLLMRPRDKSSATKCSNNLRQLGLAAIQYADDKRAFPGVAPARGLAGGTDTNATPKTIRALVWSGYHDDPEGFICPSSYDLSIPITDPQVRGNLRLWFWSGEGKGDPTRSPVVDDLPDPTLDETSELSYGWVRRPLSPNARSTSPIGADRAQADPDLRDAVLDAHVPPGALGNHLDGSYVLHADGHVEFALGGTAEAARLAQVDDPERDGFLAIRPPARLTGAAPPGRKSRWLQEALGLLALFGPPLVVGGLLVGSVRRTPPTTAATVVDTAGDAVVRVRPSRVEVLGPEERLKLGLGARPTAKTPVVLQHQQRCPACHDMVRADDALSRCLSCRAVFHGDCVPPGGDCPTLGCRGG